MMKLTIPNRWTKVTLEISNDEYTEPRTFSNAVGEFIKSDSEFYSKLRRWNGENNIDYDGLLCTFHFELDDDAAYAQMAKLVAFLRSTRM